MSRDAEARTSAMESRGGPFSPDVQTRRALRARDKLRPAGDESAARSAARGDRDLGEPSRARRRWAYSTDWVIHKQAKSRIEQDHEQHPDFTLILPLRRSVCGRVPLCR
jgi:hypothetical protein